MKKGLLTLFAFLAAGLMAFAQTAGEKESFETMKNAANLYLLNGDFAAAKAQYDGIFKLFRQYEDFTKEIRPDYEKCLRELDKIAAAKKESERLVFSQPFVNFSYSSEAHNVTVLAGKGGTGKWEVESCPEWCKLTKADNNLSIVAEANPDPSFRNGEILIKMVVSGKTVTRGLPVLQIARPLQERSVRIITNPEGSQVTIGSDPTPRITPVTLALAEGEIPIHILRNDYFALDTYITVSADDDPKVTKEYRFDLTPRFALAKLTINAATGNLDNKNPKLFIGGKQINLDGYYGRGGVRTFNTAGSFITHLELYQDNERNFVIPLEPATYMVTATADDFEDYSYSFTVREGETVPLDVIMTPKRGTVRFFNGRNADGAVIKDGSTPIGTLADHLEVQMTADDHKISFEKKDFMSDVPTYSIHVEPGKTLDFEVNMNPLSYLTINSVPAGVEVIINGVAEGIRTPVYNKAIPLGENTITLSQKSYYPVTFVRQSGVIGAVDTLNVTMKPSFPLHILSDAFRSTTNAVTGFNVYLTSLDGGEPRVKEYDHYTDAIVDLPYGKYKYEFRRFSTGPEPGFSGGVRLRGQRRHKDLAYKGIFTFNEKHNTLHRMSYSEGGNLGVLTGELGLSDMFINAGEANSYKEMGSVSFLKFPVLPGWSTSLARATAFESTLQESALNGAPRYLFSGSFAFMNGEFRVGGGIHQYLDVDILASYAYTPQIHSLGWGVLEGMNFSYVDMTDIFFGLEFHSRLPVLNASFKVGYRMMKGNANIFGTENKKNVFTSYPFDNSGMMASIGLTLGGKDSKGANILRVFYQ
ncbi:MAG: PEGA domain-containing protein [Bacteroidales bacterium]|nr:PEGA domain-containing protein [Bacteroidales bacterium]